MFGTLTHGRQADLTRWCLITLETVEMQLIESLEDCMTAAKAVRICVAFAA